MDQKNVIVIGGTSGIGLRTAEMLRDRGYNVLVGSRSRGELDEGIPHFQIDVTKDISFPEDLPEEIHGVVYCPGSIKLKPFRGLKEDDLREDLEINLIGAVKVLKPLLKRLKKAESGSSVVMFSTVAVQRGMTFHSSVASSKGAVEGLVRSLAAELAPDIRVNAVAPSITDTPMASRILRNDEAKERSAERHPLKRVGRSDDIANMVEYLISERSSWMTGQVLHVDGGLSAI